MNMNFTTKPENMRDVIVVGGGAAGLMAAGRAKELGKSATVIERMDRTALKLGITGKGRCNVTNDCTPQDFIANVVSNPRFLTSAIYKFPPSATMAFFESMGVPLKVERGSRVFPQSDRALDIVAAMRRYASGCELIRGRVTGLILKDGVCTGVTADGAEYRAKNVILCTGGMSYPQTGSTGDGYKLARQAGHTITPTSPSLVPLEVAEPWCARLQGLSLRNVSVTLRDENENAVCEEFGELLFTHFGLSGPTILSLSSHMKPDGKYKIAIGLKPALDDKTLDARVLSDFAKYSNKNFENALCDLLPQKLIPVIIELSGIDKFKKVNSVTHDERRNLVSLLRSLTLTFTRFRPVEEAIVTSGGVSVAEIDPKTMRSRLVSGLSFAGELIDVDAYTGGFNLQIAFSTARLAAEGCGSA